MIKLTLKLNNETLEAKGETILEAINKVVEPLVWPVSKTLIKTSGLIQVTDGKKKSEVDLRIMPLKRLINNKVAREIWAHRLEITMK